MRTTYLGVFPGLRERYKKLQEVRQMTKAELVEVVRAEAEIGKGQAEDAVEAFLGAVTKSLKKGDKLTLTGFGTFSVSNRKARTGRNPQTGEAIKIKAAKVPKFTAGKGLKEAVGGKKK
ncbi:MAG TPA: HU family DNA-binding protein [Candidatus Deferrimicrobium sp.]